MHLHSAAILPSGHERETVFFHLIEMFFGVEIRVQSPRVQVGGEELKEGARRVQGGAGGTKTPNRQIHQREKRKDLVMTDSLVSPEELPGIRASLGAGG